VRLVSVLAVVAALAACAPVTRVPLIDSAALDAETQTQKRLVVAQHLADLRQLHRIVYPMLAANAPLCGRRTAWSTGFIAETSDDHGRLFAAAAEISGLGSALTVVALAEGSPAARAGVIQGDRIVAVGGVPLAAGRRAHDDFVTLMDQFTGPEATLTIERPVESGSADEQQVVTLVRERACSMGYRVTVSEAINAYANGRELTVTSGLLRFLGADGEIAVIVGHEIAHNVMGHNSGVGAPGIAALYDFFGLGVKPRGAGAGPTLPINQAFEAEADYVGLYLMARAGFPIEAAPGVYRRFAVSAPSSIIARSGASHPSSPARVVMLGDTVREIAAKRAGGQPLFPDSKSH
jgi:Zn-dependent protease with chaperone function